ncbi:MAG: periplasmic heavy metal sensor [Pseudomonadota bacterium]
MADPNTTPSAPSKGRGLGRWGRIALFVSLALNLVIVGVVVGSLAIDGPRNSDKRPARAQETGLGPVLMALSREDRRALGRDMRQFLRGEQRTRAEARALMENVVTAVRADPFDPAAVDSLIDVQVQDVELRLSVARGLFLERLTDMSDAERAAFADRLETLLNTPPGDKRGPDGDRPPRDRSGGQGQAGK